METENKPAGRAGKIIYWVMTIFVAFGMTSSGVMQIMQTKQMVDMAAKLGYPAYFMSILGVWKILGVIALLVPKFPLVKEWAYAGFLFTMTGALASHIITGDTGFKEIAGPIFQTGFIILSWYFRPASRKINFD